MMPRVITSRKPPVATHRQKPKTTGARTSVPSTDFRTIMRIGIKYILIPFANLCSHTMALMSRVVTLAEIPASAALGHTLSRYLESHGETHDSPNQAGSVNHDLRHATMVMCLLAGHRLSFMASTNLGKFSRLLDNYSRNYLLTKLINIPDNIKPIISKIQECLKPFVIRELAESFSGNVTSILKKSYESLDAAITSKDGELSHDLVQQKQQECMATIHKYLEPHIFVKIMMENSIADQLVMSCSPPWGAKCRHVHDLIPEKLKREHVVAAIQAGITLQEADSHYPFAIWQLLQNNRTIMNIVQNRTKKILFHTNTELYNKYTSRMTAAIQARQTTAMLSDTTERRSFFAGIGSAASAEPSKEAKRKILAEFNEATDILNNGNVTFDEFKKLKRSIDMVLKSPDLEETARKLYGTQRIKLAMLLSERYTRMDDS